MSTPGSLYDVTVFLSRISACKRVEYKRVCYYTNWSQNRPGLGKFLPEDIDPFLCTHIIYAYGKIEDNQIEHTECNDKDTRMARKG